ncbi:MAG TPA: MarR family transcriptional regulator [Actinomycetes bacterium]|nr:MarR family transcriptional regulator [Actinomycetes bacterium]
MPASATRLASSPDGRAPASRASTSALAGDLRIAVMRLARRLRNERVDVDLTLTQLSALAALERCGPTTPGHLASVERVRPPSMTRVLGGLHDRGLIERTAHPTDGRQVLVAATDDARVLLRADRQRREAWLAQQLDTLDPEQRRALRDVLPILETLVSE